MSRNTAGTRNPATTMRPAAQRKSQPVRDIPHGKLDEATVRSVLVELKARLDQLCGDGPAAAITLERALQTGLMRPRGAKKGGANSTLLNGGVSVGGAGAGGGDDDAEETETVAAPGSVTSVAAVAALWGGVNLTWTGGERSGGVFEVWRSLRVNDRSLATLVGSTPNTLFFDATVDPTEASQYYYWVRNAVYDAYGDSAGHAYGDWSSEPNDGATLTLDPTTFAQIVADNILAGSLKAAVEFDVGGAIHGGKANSADTAAGFYIDGDFVYFGANADAAYIKWTGASVEFKGSIVDSSISGGTIDGATISNTYVFADNVVYPSYSAAPLDGLYQNDKAGQSQYETGYLVRRELIESDEFTLSAPALMGAGYYGNRSYYDSVAYDRSGVPPPRGLPFPFEYENTARHDRCRTNQLGVDVYFTIPGDAVGDAFFDAAADGVHALLVYVYFDDVLDTTINLSQQATGVAAEGTTFAYSPSPLDPSYPDAVTFTVPWYTESAVTYEGKWPTARMSKSDAAGTTYTISATEEVEVISNTTTTAGPNFSGGTMVVRYRTYIAYTGDPDRVEVACRLNMFSNLGAAAGYDQAGTGLIPEVVFFTDNR